MARFFNADTAEIALLVSGPFLVFGVFYLPLKILAIVAGL